MVLVMVTDHGDLQALGKKFGGVSEGRSTQHSSLLDSRSKSQRMGTKVPSCFSRKVPVEGERAGQACG